MRQGRLGVGGRGGEGEKVAPWARLILFSAYSSLRARLAKVYAPSYYEYQPL